MTSCASSSSPHPLLEGTGSAGGRAEGLPATPLACGGVEGRGRGTEAGGGGSDGVFAPVAGAASSKPESSGELARARGAGGGVEGREPLGMGTVRASRLGLATPAACASAAEPGSLPRGGGAEGLGRGAAEGPCSESSSGELARGAGADEAPGIGNVFASRGGWPGSLARGGGAAEGRGTGGLGGDVMSASGQHSGLFTRLGSRRHAHDARAPDVVRAAPMSLVDTLADPSKKNAVIDDSVKLIDEEVASKGGLSGVVVKTGYAAVKGIKPGFIREVCDKLMPEFAKELDPIWAEGKAKGDPEAHFARERSRVADALLSVTDAKSKNAKSNLVRSTYDKMRGSAKKNVEEAVPRLAKLLVKHAG